MRGEFVRFLMVGGAKTAFTYGVYLVLLYLINPYWAYIASFAASIYPSYLLNLRFTFRAEHSAGKLVSYPLVLVAQLLAGLAALHICLQAGVSDKLAPLFSVAVAAPVGFVMTRWVIGEGKENRNPVLFLAVSAFAVSIAAVYGALLNGDLFSHGLVFSSDNVWHFLMWQDVRAGIFSFGEWNLQNASALFMFTDLPIIWAIYWLTGGSLATGGHFLGVVMMLLNALAWMLVSDRIFGKDPLRRAVIFILASMTGASVANGAFGPLGDFLIIGHFSTWVVAGFGVFLFLSAACARRLMFSFLLFILCLAGVASDPILTVWFVVPATAAGVLWAVLFRTTSPVFPSVAGIAGFICSPLLKGYFVETGKGTIQYSGFGSLEQVVTALENVGTWAAETAARHPVLAVLWVLFFTLLAVEVFKSVRNTRSNRGRYLDNTEPERLFVPLFFLFTSGASVGAAVLSGNFFIEVSSEAVLSGRYFIPARAAALFIGWAFLPTVVRIAPSVRTLAVAAVALAAVCAPRALVLKDNGAAFVNYYPPSAQCFDKGVRRFGLKKGLATYWWTKSTMAVSKAEVQIAQVSVYFSREGNILLYPWKFGIADRFYEGPFDFIIANNTKGPPDRDWCTAYGCPDSPRDPLSTYILSPDRARAFAAQLGRQPSAVFKCEGAEVLVFKPPL